jgi:hypothetical protein
MAVLGIARIRMNRGSELTSAVGRIGRSALVVLLTVACLGPRVPDEQRSFFQLPRKTQPVELRRKPLEEQLDLYIAGVTGIHPGRRDLGLVIGEQGPAIVPALLARMRRSTKGHVKAHIAWIMVGMPCTAGTADSVRTALSEMRSEVNSIRPHSSKELAEHFLKLAEERCQPSRVAPPVTKP